ncbi:sensor histidine kinase [Aporhodopirellula aestuarii]|uniref:histidine kinase n=1 Tax=Aporhodopirellula aestuarii TaxID=2950107 RepID=A0ABT0U8G0_9BACT|nr:HAMP domain-containing sensor histidine kinase [Aporhodopirellula aestuarii]MCM2373171.1 HAMP domain-containing histidine kinase [Aporhodopirellula aestuarii]
MRDDRLAWPILLLLLIVLVPSLGMTWMMREAIRNERLAADQRLQEAYEIQLQSASQMIRDRWSDQIEREAEMLEAEQPEIDFERLVSQGFIDSVLICDDQGKLIYPDVQGLSRITAMESDPRWRRAQRLEFVEQEYDAARDVYAELSRNEGTAASRCRAQQAQVRCSLKLNETDAALVLLTQLAGQSETLDEQGRSFAAAAELQMLELLEPDTDQWNKVSRQLQTHLNDYRNPMSSSQRQFLMRRLKELDLENARLPTQGAELLASEAAAVFDSQFATPDLKLASLPGVWSRSSSDGRLIELYKTTTLKQRLLELADNVPLPINVTFVVSLPQEVSPGMVDVSLGVDLGGLRLGLQRLPQNGVDDSSQQRRAVHVWIALLVFAITCVLAWLLSIVLQRKLRLARLKNDLVATVSHELKTPLSSIRLLVDTLLDSDQDVSTAKSKARNREYLELISHENARLTRLIDNFLTFSRIDQRRQKFDFQIIDLRDVVEQAAAVFREHWSDVDSCLTIHHAPAAIISGDKDVLVTVVVNLLENAWKYSGENRQISATTSVDGAYVLLAVQDNGIGMNARMTSRIFERFFQVDQRVARSRGGCGLGLSIVHAIVDSHGGSIRVESEPDVGSTFTVQLPVANKSEKHGILAKNEGLV